MKIHPYFHVRGSKALNDQICRTGRLTSLNFNSKFLKMEKPNFKQNMGIIFKDSGSYWGFESESLTSHRPCDKKTQI